MECNRRPHMTGTFMASWEKSRRGRCPRWLSSRTRWNCIRPSPWGRLWLCPIMRLMCGSARGLLGTLECQLWRRAADGLWMGPGWEREGPVVAVRSCAVSTVHFGHATSKVARLRFNHISKIFIWYICLWNKIYPQKYTRIHCFMN